MSCNQDRASRVTQMFAGLALVSVSCKANPTPAEQQDKAAVSVVQASSTAPAPRPKVAPAGAPETKSDPTLCPGLCDKTQPLGCGMKPAQCLAACEQMLALPVCGSEVRGVYDCLLQLPASAFECASDGSAEVKSGHCDQEQGRVAECVRRAGGGL